VTLWVASSEGPAGDPLASTRPAAGEGAWELTNIDGTHPHGDSSLNGVSCPAPALCVAVDDAGNVAYGPPTALTPPAVEVALTSGRVRAGAGGRVRVPLSCQSPTRCAGTYVLARLASGQSCDNATDTLASGRYDMGAHSTRALALTLNRAGRRSLRAGCGTLHTVGSQPHARMAPLRITDAAAVTADSRSRRRVRAARQTARPATNALAGHMRPAVEPASNSTRSPTGWSASSAPRRTPRRWARKRQQPPLGQGFRSQVCEIRRLGAIQPAR
jgi:hypothetical protein